MTYEPDELEAALIDGDPEDVIPMDKIRAMAQAVRDAGYVKGEHAHRFGAGAYEQQTERGMYRMTWTETCRCGYEQVRYLVTPIVEGEA